MRAFYCDHFVLPLPAGHRFPMEKYRLLRERVGRYPTIELRVPDPATDEQLLRVHTSGYVGRVVSGALTAAEVRRIGFPWSAELVERSRRSVGGTVAAAHAALDDGVAGNLAGGTHHAFADRGEGFCVFNDVAVAARDVRAGGRATGFAVLDLDVHQGNGTAAIFAEDDGVFTASVHGAKNYPFAKERSDLDIELPDGANDARFLDAVEVAITAALEAGPELLFYVAGADAFEGDRLGRLSVTKSAMAERDALVLDRCGARGVPVVVVMAGGYAAEVTDTVDIHETTFTTASRYAREGART